MGGKGGTGLWRCPVKNSNATVLFDKVWNEFLEKRAFNNKVLNVKATSFQYPRAKRHGNPKVTMGLLKDKREEMGKFQFSSEITARAAVNPMQTEHIHIYREKKVFFMCNMYE